MNIFGFFILAASCSLALCESAVEYEDGVMILTTEKFAEVIGHTKYVLVEFYAPWCGHCKALAPEYAKAAQQLREEGSDLKLAKVDTTVEEKLGETYEVRGYPTLKFFRDGSPVEYEGGRKAADILKWLEKRTGPSCKVIATENEATKFINSEEVVVMGYFSEHYSGEARVFRATAEKIDDLAFGQVTDAKVASALGLQDGKFVIMKKTDEERLTYDGIYNDQDVIIFIINNRIPLVGEFKMENSAKLFGGPIKMHNILFVRKSDTSFPQLINQFKIAAAEFFRKIQFIFIDIEVSENSQIMDFFAVQDADCPEYRIFNAADGRAKYKPPTKDFTSGAIIRFTEQVVLGNVERHLKTEEIPEDWNKSPVHVLVGKNFRDVALDENKKVFVEFYAPWCGHCQKLEPIWDQLGEHYEERDDIVIAKMNSIENEINMKEVKITGFPTIKYFPNNEEAQIVDYNGERTLEAMINFIDAGGVMEDDEEEEVDEVEEDSQEKKETVKEEL